jgi:hypothetical protein
MIFGAQKIDCASGEVTVGSDIRHDSSGETGYRSPRRASNASRLSQQRVEPAKYGVMFHRHATAVKH